MERNDNHSVSKNTQTINVPFFHSIRLRILLLVLFPMLFCILTIQLLSNTSIHANEEIRSAFEQQSNLYQNLTLHDSLIDKLSNYLSSRNEPLLEEYRNVEAEFSAFLEQLQENGIYSQSMANMGENLLLTAEETINQTGNTSEMLRTYHAAEQIQTAMSDFSPYVAKEIQNKMSTQIETDISTVSRTLRNDRILLVFILFLLIAAAFFIAQSIIQPLTALTVAAQSISISDRTLQLKDTNRQDELGILMHTFQDMVNRIHEQLNELEDKQKIEQMLQQEKAKTLETENQLVRSELNVYQSQINSHFLFNAFNTVSRLAYLENAPQVQHSVSLIAQFLRNIMTQFNRTVTVEEEFSIVENYIEIQTMRFGDRIKAESSLDADTEWFSIPALTMQPLVENAYRHGLSDRKEGYIRYAAETVDDGILLYVWDDGSGISPERQEQIRGYFTETFDNTSSDDCLGLRNVYHRLLLMYPKRVELFLESEENVYTQIGFKILLC